MMDENTKIQSISWNEIEGAVDKFAEANRDVDVIVGIARGGLPIAT